MSKSIVLALAQLAQRVGDVDGNVQRIIDAAVDARDRLGAELLVTPELSLIGYPPDDLLSRSATPRIIDAGVQRLLAEVRGITVIVGLPEVVDEHGERRRYNSALVIRDGVVVGCARKQRLPNYGVFDERRHFAKSTEPTLVFEQSGVKIGLCICEDLWSPEPALDARAGGAELLLNINASPFELSKSAARRAVFAARTKEAGLPIAYVNCVGGQDDVLFDGDSVAVQADGTLAMSAPLFEPGVFALRFHDGRWQPGAQREDEPIEAIVYRGLVCSVRDYVDRNGFPGALIGLSGGIDSALVAAIAADALGADRVWGVSLPSRYTLDMSNDDARLEAEALGIRYSVLPIEPAFEAFNATLADTFAGRPVDLTEENIQSRCRGVLLMALSNKFGPVVLTTGNKSEMAVGYSTLYGDMCGGFAPIKDVYKTLVYRLAVYRNTLAPAGKPVIPERVITRPPSAELRPDQKDSDSLPPYEILDPVLELYVENELSIREIVARGYDEAIVRRIATLVRRSEYKRRQAPPGPKVTRCAFGRERRYPLTAVYGEI